MELRPLLQLWRQRLFPSWGQTVLSLFIMGIMFWGLWNLVHFFILDANFTAHNSEECKTSAGMCWAFVRVMAKPLAFGHYPQDLIYRPVCVLLLGLSLFAWRFMHQWTLRLVHLGLVLMFSTWLMAGGAGLVRVDVDQWGGLWLNLFLTVTSITLALPLGYVLNLGRQSKRIWLRYLCLGWVEGFRAVPLMTVLIASSLIMPYFLPPAWEVNKLWRAVLALAFFQSAYFAETFRSGFLAVSFSQIEAARALGLSPWQQHILIFIPQIFRYTLPALVNSTVSMLKDTTLVIQIALLDVMGMVKSLGANSQWIGLDITAYGLIALVFWTMCNTISIVGKKIELRMQQS